MGTFLMLHIVEQRPKNRLTDNLLFFLLDLKNTFLGYVSGSKKNQFLRQCSQILGCGLDVYLAASWIGIDDLVLDSSQGQ
jgi:hypothetical protein